MDLGIDGKAVLVTGAASGVGRATASAFAAEGARVALVDRDGEGLAAVREEIVAAGGMADAWEADVSDATQVERCVGEAIAELGGLDIAFNNAAITQGATPLHETSDEVYERLMAVNVRGVWLGMRAQLRHMY